MHVLVTGAAGFIGSTLCETLVSAGHTVVGVDTFTDYYDPCQKRRNVEWLTTQSRFELAEVDLRAPTSLEVLDSAVDVIFHLAAQPGVRGSWGTNFSTYVENNVGVTQALLERALQVRTSKFVYASSSSVYGRPDGYPTSETVLPSPHSPYGVTKLAAEHLCGLYAQNYGIETVSLRYFTVYGPRQRPDMAIARLIEAASSGGPFPLYGDGEHIRDFTYVDDVVRANVLAASADLPPGTVLNVAGGSEARMADVILLVEDIVGSSVRVERHPASAGDVMRTGGDTAAIRDCIGWSPEVSLREGITRQFRSGRDES